MKLKIESNFLAALAVCWLISTGIFLPAPTTFAQQMEVRQAEEYDVEQFAKSKPAVGTEVPALELQSLAGKSVKLSDYLGKTIVVIKAGYT